MPSVKVTSCIAAAVLFSLSESALAQNDGNSTGWGSSSSARTIAGAIIGVLLGLIVFLFAIVVVRRHQRIYGRPQMPSVELRRVSSYVSVYTRRQNAELGVNDQGPGYSAPPYGAQPPPYNGPENLEDPKQVEAFDAADPGVGGLGYDVAPLPAKGGLRAGSVDVVDAEGRYAYDVPPPSPSDISSASTPPPPPTPPDEEGARAWYKAYP
ncbi:uncharacterized protein B0H18DRAFT_1004377 [Fomitopsis serialis]|uniref:uncharacterized protein n=1 Tax=Fomitopsis serialis TaxID=139415 RepID=UPI00200811F6|nr:uncharacterized protein B0H18DRAFT_1004377 [Neoantrodia serialis]KAH9926897.1 hypothetical protein B0H18DRAFT_1004377 [Neoantrodia serialis]